MPLSVGRLLSVGDKNPLLLVEALVVVRGGRLGGHAFGGRGPRVRRQAGLGAGVEATAGGWAAAAAARHPVVEPAGRLLADNTAAAATTTAGRGKDVVEEGVGLCLVLPVREEGGVVCEVEAG